MKRLNSGFTLAEVLITLAIIGVVAAIVLPSVMSNYQYKSVGVKLAKFLSTVEGSARAYAVSNDNFSHQVVEKTNEKGEKVQEDVSNVTDFINEVFIFKSFDPKTSDEAGAVQILKYPNVIAKDLDDSGYGALTGSATTPVAYLKDGTAIQVYIDDTAYSTTSGHSELVPVVKYGAPVFRITFDPKVQGLPKTAHKNFNFTVTELGYLFPHEDDDCLWSLYNNGFNTTSKDFDVDKACYITTPTTP